jgi:hypothetical protein
MLWMVRPSRCAARRRGDLEPLLRSAQRRSLHRHTHNTLCTGHTAVSCMRELATFAARVLRPEAVRLSPRVMARGRRKRAAPHPSAAGSSQTHRRCFLGNGLQTTRRATQDRRQRLRLLRDGRRSGRHGGRHYRRREGRRDGRRAGGRRSDGICPYRAVSSQRRQWHARQAARAAPAAAPWPAQRAAPAPRTPDRPHVPARAHRSAAGEPSDVLRRVDRGSLGCVG